jgi:hypothetical protein
MARDKAKDDKFFNCSEKHEIEYVAGLYTNTSKVREFLKSKCKNNQINYSTHMQVYELIKKELKYSIPV